MSELSICVPTYNRAVELDRMLRSTRTFDGLDVTLVIVDDGSTDDTDKVVYRWSKTLRIAYHKMAANVGRAHALDRALREAQGEFIMIMDSDDVFSDACGRLIAKQLLQLRNNCEGKNVIGACFSCATFEGKLIGDHIPSTLVSGTLDELRADLRIKGDKKEIVRRDMFQKALVQPFIDERRFPTSVYWHAISRLGEVLFSNEAIVMKEYRPDGMSSNIARLKAKNKKGLALAYYMASSNFRTTYESFRYAVKYGVLYGKTVAFLGKDQRAQVVYKARRFHDKLADLK